MTLKEQNIKAIDETLETMKDENFESFKADKYIEEKKKAFIAALCESESGMMFLHSMTVQGLRDGNEAAKSILAAMTAATLIEETFQTQAKTMSATAN